MSQFPILSYISMRQPIAIHMPVYRVTDVCTNGSTSQQKQRWTAKPSEKIENHSYPTKRSCLAFTTRLVALAFIGCLTQGCQTTGPVKTLSQTDRLMATYPDLKSGKFALVADFESPTHMELVQLLGVSQSARSVRSTTLGRSETGGACLSFTSGSAHDTLTLSNNFATKWYLRRDWRPYDLLLMAVQAPRDNLTLDLTILSGAKNNQLAAGMKERLSPGWNLLRIDLAELGERIPLDDIRELKLAILGTTEAVQINIDDIILTSSSDYLLGKADGDADSLYFQRKGRRWHIGASKRFELVFANGQIVGWYNTELDPYKLKNLVQNTALGPMPILLDQQGKPIDLQPEQRHNISTHQHILEISPVRIVLQSNWQFTNEQGLNLPGNPKYAWTYTIYPTGQVYADVLIAPPNTNPPDSKTGIMVSLASENENTWLETIKPKNSESKEPSPYAFARSSEANTLILFAPSATNNALPHTSMIQSRFDRKKKVSSWIYTANPLTSGQFHYQCQIYVASSMSHKDEELRLRTQRSFTRKSGSLEVGSLVAAESSSDSGRHIGTIDIAPDGSNVRLILDNSDRQFFTPCIRIHDRSNRRAWVYVDHLIYKKYARESDGYLVFQLPELAHRKIVVEVLFQQ